MDQHQVGVSVLVRVEVATALARRVREGSVTTEQRDLIVATFLADLARFVHVEVDADVVRSASDLALAADDDAPLRAIDAVHLASALHLAERARAQGISLSRFVTSDRQLRRAAERAGLPVLDPTVPPNEQEPG